MALNNLSFSNMKIGIVTLPLFTNYGGILQAFALQKALESLGHEPVTFTQDVKMHEPWWKLPAKWTKRCIFNSFSSYKTPVFAEYKFNRTADTVSQFTRQYIQRNIQTRHIRSWEELKEKDYDALIVGSDQIWRPMYFKEIEQAYLKFAKNWTVRKIAYAASFGTDQWEYSPTSTQTCRNLLKQFNAVSVREKSGVTLCKEYLQRQATVVLDPTLLIPREEYIKTLGLFSQKKAMGNLLLYILDETSDKKKAIEKLSEQYTPFCVNSKVDNLNCKLSERIQPPVEEWLKGFMDAEFVFTDSFHACVFSIIFNKPFLVYANQGRGLTRFTSFLSLLGLQDRLITQTKDLEGILLKDIDWNAVNQKVEILRTESLEFLKSNLQD